MEYLLGPAISITALLLLIWFELRDSNEKAETANRLRLLQIEVTAAAAGIDVPDTSTAADAETGAATPVGA